MYVDYHAHTPWCHHAIGEPRAYVEAAERMGLREFGFSEHSPWMMGQPSHHLAPSRTEWVHYMADVQELQAALRAKRSAMALRLGIEMDYTPNQEATAREFLAQHEFDHVIGSVHAVMPVSGEMRAVWNEQPDDVRQLFERYFSQMKQMLATGLIDIVGHMDLPKRNGIVPKQGYLDLVEALVPALREAGVAVEINTSGRDKTVREFFPAPEIVKLLVGHGIPFTLGSDAHSPADVGRYFDEAVALLRACGAKEILRFEKRKRYGVAI